MSHEPGRRPTLASVAGLAGVSRQTVSNVLNDPARVQADTLARVRAVLDEVGYRPHLAARQLRTKRSNVIGLRLHAVTDGINGSVLDRFLHALTEGAQRRGYRVVLFTADDDRSEIARYRELLDTTDIDAFVLTATHHGDERTQWLTEQNIPFVTFGRPWSQDADAAPHSWVDVDASSGTRSATEHLLGLGHRRIGFIGWPRDSGIGAERHAGWHTTMREAGVEDLADLEVLTEDGVPEGRRAARHLLASTAPPTALVCVSDSLALGAMSAPGPAGRDLTIIGFDNTPVAAAVGLSSVDQPLVEVAEACLDQLVAQLNGHDAVLHRLLAPELVIRPSTSTPDPRA